MHAYQAYRADGKFEAVMDSGANINIFTDELENGLTNARHHCCDGMHHPHTTA